MHKLFSTIIMLLIVTISFSQTEKGTWNLGISSNFGNIYSDGPAGSSSFGGFTKFFGFKDNGDLEEGFSITSYNFQPGVGYFLVNGLLLRFNLAYSYYDTKDDDEITFSSTIVSAGPELRYYFGDRTIKQYFGVNANFGSSNTKFTYDGEEVEKLSLSRYSAYAGLVYFIGQHASIDMSLGLTATSQTNKVSNDLTKFVDVSINLGVNFFF